MTNEELVYLYQKGDKKALDKLIERNKGIVYKLANKFYVEKTNSIDREDLEQEGFIGLMAAAKKYKKDIENPAKFTTYAVYWVYSKISRYVNQRSTNEETSLNIPIGEDGENELLDTIEGVDYGFENVEERLYIQKLHEELEEAMLKYNTLQEREILKLRYGWNNVKPMKLREIGEVFNISHGCVRRVEAKARRKIRNTPWGQEMRREMYIKKAYAAKYNIQSNLEFMEWKNKYIT
ncbi:sigma-70 family RNA polymerase sigma factor [Haloimpatiens massiliensis]|uniref:sigma-70 family RNA polymerase sigma factor n=1 Tax=Haloimpatiens massiliensis TaxID=1658110 RepID=UPI000C8473D2|nr:sigma-70 family RNA polymerase sigma factor [Haloimpatiens massiliensis]